MGRTVLHNLQLGAYAHEQIDEIRLQETNLFRESWNSPLQTYPKTLTQKTIEHWIGKTVGHGEPVTEEVEQIVRIVAVQRVQVDHGRPEGKDEHEQLDGQPAEDEEHQNGDQKFKDLLEGRKTNKIMRKNHWNHVLWITISGNSVNKLKHWSQASKHKVYKLFGSNIITASTTPLILGRTQTCDSVP